MVKQQKSKIRSKAKAFGAPKYHVFRAFGSHHCNQYLIEVFAW